MPEDNAVTGYQPGGQGIHRQREEDMPKRFGEEYKAKVDSLLCNFLFVTLDDSLNGSSVSSSLVIIVG